MTLRVIASWLVAATATSLGAQKLPPVHLLDRPVAESPRSFKSVSAIRALAGGKLLANDPGSHRLLLLDSTLRTIGVVADSTAGSPTSYGPTPDYLLRYTADSSILVLPRVPSMFLIDPDGRFVRVMSVPRPQDAAALSTSLGGNPGFDAKGGLVFRGRTTPVDFPKVVVGGPPERVVFPDTVPLVRFDPATHKLDTLARYRVPRISGYTVAREGAGPMTMLDNDPLPLTDEWAITADGTVAVIRGQDYHVDFIDAAGVVTKGPKMLFAWEHLTDEAKVALIDSVRRADSLSELLSSQTPPKPVASAGTQPPTAASSGGGLSVSTAAPGGPHLPTPYVSPQELPDYRPPFLRASVRADADNNVWIATTHRGPFGAGVVYDVVSRAGVVIDRVQLLPGRTVAGFARGGIVYLAAKTDAGTALERTAWHAPQ